MRIILSILVFSFSIVLNAQTANTASIFITTSSGKGLYIDIHYRIDTVEIIYAQKDSTSMTRFQQDSLSKVWLAPKSKKGIKKLMEKIMEPKTGRLLPDIKYGYFTRDTLILSKAGHPDYYETVSQVIQEDGEKLAEDIREGNWYTLHGTSFRIICFQGDELLWRLSLNSPRQDSHPQVFSLINETLSIYRNKNPNSFLDKSKLGIGY